MPVILNRRIERPLAKQILSIPEFVKKRRKVLVQRNAGGLGDILVHRMLFEDMKRIMPDSEIHFACPVCYHPAVSDHPFLDSVLDCGNVNRDDYMIYYNTTTPCIRYEMKTSPLSGLNRSDIWAEYCGIPLAKHSMHIRMEEEELEWARVKIESMRDRPGPVALLCPISTMFSKDMNEEQQLVVAEGLRERGCCVMSLHTEPSMPLYKRSYPCLFGVGIRKWMALIAVADYIVSVDTAAFHCAGGMGKPLMGFYTFADGKVYGKYYDCVIVQKHRDNDLNWTCGPCYNWTTCPKSKLHPLPCATSITRNMLLAGLEEMFQRWPINNME